MENFLLKFIAPKTLDGVTQAQSIDPPAWHDQKTGLPLELNTTNWDIQCENSVSRIDLWLVNQDTLTMKLLSDKDVTSDGFEPLDYSFAVSMIGQLVGKEKLIKYLGSLMEVFTVIPAPVQKINEQDNSTDNLPNTDSNE